MASYYTPDDLNDRDRDALELIADARGIDVTGTGRDGYVTKDDLISAISADQDRTGLNPAIVAEPEPDTVQGTWKVTGTQETLGHQPGETFTATLPRQQADLLTMGGHITPTENKEN